MDGRLITVVVSAIALIAGIAYLNARLDRANEADALAVELKGVKEQAELVDQKAVALETTLAQAREAEKETNRKWNQIRANKDRGVCLLDAVTVRLLQSAGTGDPR